MLTIFVNMQEADDVPTSDNTEGVAAANTPVIASALPPTAGAPMPTADAATEGGKAKLPELSAADGDETEADEVEEALAALDQLVVSFFVAYGVCTNPP